MPLSPTLTAAEANLKATRSHFRDAGRRDSNDINDDPNGGMNARPPTGDDYNDLWSDFQAAMALVEAAIACLEIEEEQS